MLHLGWRSLLIAFLFLTVMYVLTQIINNVLPEKWIHYYNQGITYYFGMGCVLATGRIIALRVASIQTRCQFI